MRIDEAANRAGLAGAVQVVDKLPEVRLRQQVVGVDDPPVLEVGIAVQVHGEDLGSHLSLKPAAPLGNARIESPGLDHPAIVPLSWPRTHHGTPTGPGQRSQGWGSATASRPNPDALIGRSRGALVDPT